MSPPRRQGRQEATTIEFRRHPEIHYLTAGKDELYSYDGLDRLMNWKRSDLNGTYDGMVGTPGEEQGFGLEALGNWSGHVRKAGALAALDQTRKNIIFSHTGFPEI